MMDDRIWNQPPADPPEIAPPTLSPVLEQPSEFRGRTPGRGAAIRGGVILGATLVLAIGSAVVLGASPASVPSAGVGAGPSATPGAPSGTTGGKPGGSDRRGNGRGFGPFGLGSSFGGAGGPFAGKLGPGRDEGLGFGRITVSAISGTALTLATADGWTRTITVPSTAKVTKGGQPATIADVSVGDTIRFGEKRNSDGTYTSTAVAVVLPRTAGVVTAVAATSVTVALRDGTSETIQTTPSTTYRLGPAAGSRSDVKVSARIGAVGERASDGTFTASTIEIVVPRVLGTVTDVSGSSVTIRRPDGTTMTIHVAAGATIDVRGVQAATLGDLKAGMILIARGTQRSDGSLDASAIRAGEPGKRGPANRPGEPGPEGSAEPSSGPG